MRKNKTYKERVIRVSRAKLRMEKEIKERVYNFFQKVDLAKFVLDFEFPFSREQVGNYKQDFSLKLY